MSVKITEKGTKKFSKKEKLAILKEAGEKGVKLTLEKYNLYPGTFYYWKNKFEQFGEAGMEHRKIPKNQLAQIRKLEKENQTLKVLLAEEQLENKLKDELLKKKYPHLKDAL